MIIKFYFIYIVSLIYYWLTFFFYRFNPDTGLLGMSYSVFKMSDLHPLGKLILSVFSLLRLVTVEEGVGEDKKSTRVNNLTLINFVIKVLGPLHERTLTIIIMGIQVKLLIKNLYQYLWRTTLQSHNYFAQGHEVWTKGTEVHTLGLRAKYLLVPLKFTQSVNIFITSLTLFLCLFFWV